MVSGFSEELDLGVYSGGKLPGVQLSVCVVTTQRVRGVGVLTSPAEAVPQSQMTVKAPTADNGQRPSSHAHYVIIITSSLRHRHDAGRYGCKQTC